MTYNSFKHKNNARALQLGSISAGAVTVICASGYGELFPTTFPFQMVLENFVNATGLVSKREIVIVTNRVADTFTITRSAGFCPASSSAVTQTNTAFSFTPDDDNTVVMSQKLTAEDLDDMNAELARLLAIEIPARVAKAGDNMTGLFKEAQGADIASATTTDLSTATGNSVKITGTTTITGFGTVQAGTCMKLTFTGILTLTYNATSMILPKAGTNITTASGDSGVFVSLGSWNWKCISYNKADGTALAVASTGTGWETIASWQLTSASATLMNVTSISTNYDCFRLRVFHVNSASAIRNVWLRFNADAGGNYNVQNAYASSSSQTNARVTSQSEIRLASALWMGLSEYQHWQIEISKPLTTTKWTVIWKGQVNTGSSETAWTISWDWNNTSSKITGISIINTEDSSTIFEAGSFYILEWFTIT